MRRAECPICHATFDYDEPLPDDGSTAVKHPISCANCRFVPLVIYYSVSEIVKFAP